MLSGSGNAAVEVEFSPYELEKWLARVETADNRSLESRQLKHATSDGTECG